MQDNATEPLRLWITYPWMQREEGDFTYLIPQLEAAGIRARYQAIEIKPDTQLWASVEKDVTAADIDGLAFVLTPVSITRRKCTEELLRILDRTAQIRGPEFPMFGLLHGVSAQSLPPALRIRPAFAVLDPGWKRQAAAMLRSREKHAALVDRTRFLWTLHSCYGGDPGATAIEVTSRGESIPYWRFAVPKSVSTARWGQGPRGGGEISPVKFSVVRGSAQYGPYDVNWFGAANAISQTESAYAVFAGPMPEFICFGPAKSPMGPPDKMEMFRADAAGRRSESAA